MFKIGLRVFSFGFGKEMTWRGCMESSKQGIGIMQVLYVYEYIHTLSLYFAHNVISIMQILLSTTINSKDQYNKNTLNYLQRYMRRQLSTILWKKSSDFQPRNHLFELFLSHCIFYLVLMKSWPFSQTNKHYKSTCIQYRTIIPVSFLWNVKRNLLEIPLTLKYP